MKQKFTRHVVRLLMLFAGLFAISNVGWAANLVYFNNTSGWNTVNYYLFSSSSSTNADNHPSCTYSLFNGAVWAVEANSYPNVIFTNGTGWTNKTADLNVSANHIYQSSDSKNSTGREFKLNFQTGLDNYDTWHEYYASFSPTSIDYTWSIDVTVPSNRSRYFQFRIDGTDTYLGAKQGSNSVNLGGTNDIYGSGMTSWELKNSDSVENTYTITYNQYSNNKSTISVVKKVTTPQTYDYYLHIFGGGLSNYEDKKLTPGTALELTANDYKGCSFVVKVCNSGSEDSISDGWYSGTTTTVTAGTTTNFTLVNSGGNDIGPLPNATSGKFTFTLTTNSSNSNTAMPTKLAVYSPAEAQLPKTTYTFYVDVSKTSWGTPYVHYYGFPGVDNTTDDTRSTMTPVDGYNRVYKFTVQSTGDIGNDTGFNFLNQKSWDGCQQSQDIKGTGAVKNNHVYVLTDFSKDSSTHWDWNDGGDISSYSQSGNPDPDPDVTLPEFNNSYVKININPTEDRDNNWTLYNTYHNTSKPYVDEYLYVYKPTTSSAHHFQFCINSGGRDQYYFPSWGGGSKDSELQDKVDWTEAQCDASHVNSNWWASLTANTYYTIKVTLNYKGTNGDHRFTIEQGVPTFYTKDQSKAGHVYLLAKQLNNESETPEWRMERQGNNSNTYKLTNFAMRSEAAGGKPYVAWYSQDGTRNIKVVESTDNVSLPTSNESERQPGWAYQATFVNGSKPSLDIRPMSTTSYSEWGDDVLPYIGVLGANFKQANSYTTPLDGHHERVGNTDKGWQEAYIQYNETGQPVLDENGHAYYNTYWPPRNNILMKSELKNTSLNVSTLNTTMALDTENKALTTSQWNSLLKVSEETSDYHELKLGDSSNQKYVRYTVNNMWMYGQYKLWTGWAGEPASWGAQWNHHLFFGPYDGKLEDTTKTLETTGFKQTYYPSSVTGTGNYEIDKPLYFKTMELFIPVETNADGTIKSMKFDATRLYFTQSDGNAQIDATTHEVSKNDTHAGYLPSIESIPSGYKLDGYEIRRYIYDPNVKDDNYQTCDKQNQASDDPADYVVAHVDSGLGLEGTSGVNTFNGYFKDYGVFSKHVDDGTYGSGLYIYSLTIYLKSTDGNNTIKPSTVWSPWIQIVDNNFTVNLEAAQLIKLPTSSNPFSGYTHVTYNELNNPVLLNIEDGVVVDADRASSVSGFSATRYREVIETTGTWTNTAVVRSAEPANLLSQTSHPTITTFNVTKKGQTQEIATFEGLDKIGTYYYALVDNGTQIAKSEYTVHFAGSGPAFDKTTTVTTGNISKDATYTPHFMMPAFDDAKSKVYFDKDESSTSYTASHGDLQYHADADDSNAKQQSGVTSVRHELRADLVLKMPNVEPSIKQAVYNAMNITFGLDGQNYTTKGKYDGNVTDYGLSYRYQNPADWVEFKNDEWKGISRTWSISTANFGEGVSAVKPTLASMPLTKTLTVTPSFSAPTVEKASVNYYYTGDFDGKNSTDGNHLWKIDLFVRSIEVEPGDGDDFTGVGGKDLTWTINEKLGLNGEDVTFLMKASFNHEDISDKPEDVDKIEFIPISKVVNYYNLTHGVFEDEESDGPTYLDEPVGSVSMPYYDNYDAQGQPIQANIDRNFANLNYVFQALGIDLGYAYYFTAGFGGDENGTNFEGESTSNTQSGYMGFVNDKTDDTHYTFPTIRYDHDSNIFGTDHPDEATGARLNAPRRVSENGITPATGDDATKKLAEGDNAFLFVPAYQTAKVSSIALPDNSLTGVEEVAVDYAASLIVGRGFIDLNGSEGAVYSTDGRLIYHGDSRVNVASGVYVVTYGPQSVKVLVK